MGWIERQLQRTRIRLVLLDMIARSYGIREEYRKRVEQQEYAEAEKLKRMLLSLQESQDRERLTARRGNSTKADGGKYGKNARTGG